MTNIDIIEFYNFIDNQANFNLLSFYFSDLFLIHDTDEIKKNKLLHFLVFYKLFKI